MAELKEIVIQGPDPETDGVVRWRCVVDLRAKMRIRGYGLVRPAMTVSASFAARFAITFHQSSVAKLLRKLGLTRLQPRPYHPKKDAAAQEAVRNFAGLVNEALPAAAAGKPVELWFQML